jgi:bacteriorhodopsin
MHNYTEALIWYSIWPLLIYIAYRFVLLNLRHHAKMERLEELEARYANEQDDTTQSTH